MIGAAACGLAYPIREGELDSESLGADGAANTDGSGSSPDSSSGDGSNGGNGEAGNLEAGVDPTRPCTPISTDTSLCVDFDKENDVKDHFSFYASVGPFGTVVFDSTYSVSPERSALITLQNGNVDTCEVVQLRATLPAAGKIHAEVAFRVDQGGATAPFIGSPLGLALLNSQTSNTSCVLGLLMGADSAIGAQGTLPDGTPYEEYPIATSMVRSEWYRVVYDIDRTVKPATLSLSVNGTPQLTNQPLMGACDGPGAAEFRLGPNCFGPQSTPLQTRFDNVFFEVSPP